MRGFAPLRMTTFTVRVLDLDTGWLRVTAGWPFFLLGSGFLGGGGFVFVGGEIVEGWRGTGFAGFRVGGGGGGRLGLGGRGGVDVGFDGGVGVCGGFWRLVAEVDRQVIFGRGGGLS